MRSRARRNDLVRRVRTVAVHLVRKYGLIPTGTADRFGDDDQLAGSSLSQTVMVYFPGTQQELYQLRQWYGPLRALDGRHPVVVVLQDSRTARIVRAELGLPAITIARYGTLDDLLSRSEVKVALYVGHQPLNFDALRFTSLVHVFLNHGDSDKGVAVSNQCKAYDFLFLPGQAAIDRINGHTMLYDAAAHCRLVGRPQLDFDRPPEAARRGDRPVVLYAPTWEGAQPSVSYGSVASHGPQLVQQLLADGRFAVVYRPHPLAGVNSSAYGDADAQVRRLVQDAAAGDTAAGHRIDTDLPFSASAATADVMVCDVSAVAMEWLPLNRPFLVTLPMSPAAVPAATRMLDVVPRLAVEDLDHAAALVAEQFEGDPGRTVRPELVGYYLGDTTPGAATLRFLNACTDVIGLRDWAWADVLARRPAVR